MENHGTNRTSLKNNSIPVDDSDHGQEPPPPTTVLGGGENPESGDSVTTPEPKKRKGCPSPLHKCEAVVKKKSAPLNSDFSFTFDTKFCGGSELINTPESTPKFGSFNLGESGMIERKEEGGDGNKGNEKIKKFAGDQEIVLEDGNKQECNGKK